MTRATLARSASPVDLALDDRGDGQRALPLVPRDAHLLEDLDGHGDHGGELVRGARVLAELVGRGEQPALDVAVRLGGQPDRLGVLRGLLVLLDGDAGRLRQGRERLGGPQALTDRRPVGDAVARVGQHVEGLLGRHPLGQGVAPRLDGRRPLLVGVGDPQVGAAGLDDASVEQGPGDVLAGLPGLDDDVDPHAAGAGEVVGLRLGEQPGDHRPDGTERRPRGAADEDDGQEDHEQATPAAAGRPPTVTVQVATAADRGRRLPEDRLGDVVLLRHCRGSFVRGLRRPGLTRSPGGEPVLRSVSRAVWRISTAAAWSTTARCRRAATPLSRSVR